MCMYRLHEGQSEITIKLIQKRQYRNIDMLDRHGNRIVIISFAIKCTVHQ